MKASSCNRRFTRALVFCNGEFSPESVPELEADDLIICADGGLEHALALGIKPHVVLGDFVPTETCRRLEEGDQAGCSVPVPCGKDKTDGQIAVEYAQRCREIWLQAAWEAAWTCKVMCSWVLSPARRSLEGVGEEVSYSKGSGRWKLPGWGPRFPASHHGILLV